MPLIFFKTRAKIEGASGLDLSLHFRFHSRKFEPMSRFAYTLVMRELLEKLIDEAAPLVTAGRCADYIPALAMADPRAIGVAVTMPDDTVHEAGASRFPFTLQSVSKAVALVYVIETVGEEAIFSRVGKEPTGDPFDSIIRLETAEHGKPFNPMINAGAIVVSALMPGVDGEAKAAGFIDFLSLCIGNRAGISEDIKRSEAATANRNRSIAWFLKELGLIEGDVEESLDAYFRQCATFVDTVGLSRFAASLPWTEMSPEPGKPSFQRGQPTL